MYMYVLYCTIEINIINGGFKFFQFLKCWLHSIIYLQCVCLGGGEGVLNTSRQLTHTSKTYNGRHSKVLVQESISEVATFKH